MISKEILNKLYSRDGMSMHDIAEKLDCSVNKVVYWMNKHALKRRSISDAMYQRHNPHGDPFQIVSTLASEDLILYGMGMGLYWGEGTKSNKTAVRLGNTDPELIKTFVCFLTKLCGVKKADLRFGLQLFSDIDPETALNFWTQKIDADRTQFYKITVTQSGSIGTYRKKSLYGVLTVYYNNKRLRDILVGRLSTAMLVDGEE